MLMNVAVIMPSRRYLISYVQYSGRTYGMRSSYGQSQIPTFLATRFASCYTSSPR